MQQIRFAFGRLKSVMRGRGRWFIAAALVFCGPLLVVAAVRQGADVPPQKQESTTDTDANAGKAAKAEAVVGDTPSETDGAGTIAIGNLALLEPDVDKASLFDGQDEGRLAAALESAEMNEEGSGSGPSTDNPSGGAAPAVAVAQPAATDVRKKKDKPAGEKNTAGRPPRLVDPLKGAFDGGRDPNVSEMESAVEFDERKEEIEQEYECRKNSSDPKCNPAAVPVPAALPLFASGAAALGFFGRRRRRRPA